MICLCFILVHSADVYVDPIGSDGTCTKGDENRPCATFTKAFAVLAKTGRIYVRDNIEWPDTITSSGLPLTIRGVVVEGESIPLESLKIVTLTAGTILTEELNSNTGNTTIQLLRFRLGSNSTGAPFLISNYHSLYLVQSVVDSVGQHVYSSLGRIESGIMIINSVYFEHLDFHSFPMFHATGGTLQVLSCSFNCTSCTNHDSLILCEGENAFLFTSGANIGTSGRSHIKTPCHLRDCKHLFKGRDGAGVEMSTSGSITGFTATGGLGSLISWAVTRNVLFIGGTFSEIVIRDTADKGLYGVVHVDLSEMSFSYTQVYLPTSTFTPHITLPTPVPRIHSHSVQPSHFVFEFGDVDPAMALSYFEMGTGNAFADMHDEDAWHFFESTSPKNTTLTATLKAAAYKQCILTDGLRGVDSETCGMHLVDPLAEDEDLSGITPCATFPAAVALLNGACHTIEIEEVMIHANTIVLDKPFFVIFHGIQATSKLYVQFEEGYTERMFMVQVNAGMGILYRTLHVYFHTYDYSKFITDFYSNEAPLMYATVGYSLTYTFVPASYDDFRSNTGNAEGGRVRRVGGELLADGLELRGRENELLWVEHDIPKSLIGSEYSGEND